ncbi:MAG: hypothetical protein LBH81_02690 [Rickettsiales bacterium]|jgi:hypothetical protein|nr:hypothetical protein [Rickettsiales bacterium]
MEYKKAPAAHTVVKELKKLMDRMRNDMVFLAMVESILEKTDERWTPPKKK